MARDRYPDEVEIKNNDFSTSKRQKAAEALDEHWPEESFIDVVESNEFASRNTFQNVRDEHFGPTSHPVTFGEIKNMPEFERVSDWMDARERGELTDEGRLVSAVNDEEDEIEAAREQAYQKGYQDAWTEYENLLLRKLDPETYHEVQLALRDLDEDAEIAENGPGGDMSQ